MTNVSSSQNSHKKIAMQFLLNANRELDKPASAEIIEKVYDLFAEQHSETQSFQKSLQKIIHP